MLEVCAASRGAPGIAGASRYYAEQSGPPLAQSFLAEFERLIDLICQHPHIGAPYRQRTRRCLMRRFPYALVYVESDAAVRVMAIAHHRRQPGYWEGRE